MWQRPRPVETSRHTDGEGPDLYGLGSIREATGLPGDTALASSEKLSRGARDSITLVSLAPELLSSATAQASFRNTGPGDSPYPRRVRHAAIIAVAALLLLVGCGSAHRVAHRKACANITFDRKTHQKIIRRYACSDYHPVAATLSAGAASGAKNNSRTVVICSGTKRVISCFRQREPVTPRHARGCRLSPGPRWCLAFADTRQQARRELLRLLRQS